MVERGFGGTLCSKCTNVALKMQKVMCSKCSTCSTCGNVMLKTERYAEMLLKMEKCYAQNAETLCSNCYCILSITFLQFEHTVSAFRDTSVCCACMIYILCMHDGMHVGILQMHGDTGQCLYDLFNYWLATNIGHVHDDILCLK